jgi:hypothetical protein
MFPTLFGCRTPSELCRGRGWDTPWPSHLLGALPTRSWLTRLRRLGLEVLAPIWRQVRERSPAPQSRWQWPGGWDDAVCQTYGAQVGWVGRGGRGQHQRVLSGLDGLLLLVVVGEGRLLVPVALAMRRPEPVGPGAPCRDTRCGARQRRDGRRAACARRGVVRPPPSVVAERWLSDSTRMQPVSRASQGTLLVEGTQSYIFLLADGRQVTGQDLIHGEAWAWRQHPWEPGVRYVWLRATRPTDGPVTIVMVDAPRQERCSLLCLATTRSAPQLIRRWRRRRWIALVLRTLTPLLATAACQVRSADASYGHLVWRLMGSFIVFSTARVICTGRLTMEELLFALKPSWRFVDLEPLA